MPWQRPSSVKIGQVWTRFKGREINGQPAKMYQIRDMEDQYKQECIDLMAETFLRDEPLCDILGVLQDPESIATIKDNWVNYISQGMSLACFTETADGLPDELVAFNIVLVKTRDDVDEDIDQVVGESWKKVLLTLTTAENLVDVFTLYGVDKYLTSSGITVLPKHRGQNIGGRIFEARKPICRALGIQVTADVFTATASQVLAAKCGYQLLAELNYADMKTKGVDLSGCSTPCAKVMGTKFQFN